MLLASQYSFSGSLNAAGQRPNIEVTFITGKSEWNPCRQYSLNATIMTEQGGYHRYMLYLYLGWVHTILSGYEQAVH